MKEEIKDNANKKPLDIKENEQQSEQQTIIDVEPQKVENNQQKGPAF